VNFLVIKPPENDMVTSSRNWVHQWCQSRH